MSNFTPAWFKKVFFNEDFSGLHNEKERQILRFNALLLVHLQGLEPWAH